MMCSSRRLDKYLNIYEMVEMTENKQKNTFSAGSGMSDTILISEIKLRRAVCGCFLFKISLTDF